MEVSEYQDLVNFLGSPPDRREWPVNTTTKSQKNNFRRKAKVFQLLDGTLYYLHKKHSLVRVVRFEEKAAILKACHTTATAGHQGVNRTATKIRERYWWVGMQQDIVEYVDTCDKCQRQNQLRKTPSVLHPIPVHDGPFSMVGLDLVGPLQETTSGNKYIAVLTDYLTKWPEVKAIPSKHADVICDFIIEVICRHGAPKTILTDRGREFCNSLNDKLCQSMGIQHRVSAPYHPQTNGLTERFNQTLCSALTKYVSEKQDDWDQYLQQVAFAARTCQQKSAKESPFYLIYGRKAVLPIQLDIPTTVPNMQRQQTEEEFDEIYSDRITSFVELLKAHDAAKDNISIEQKKQKTYYDRKHGTADLLQPGQRVLLRNSKRINRKGDKMLHRWTGPYTISTCIGKGVYKLVERKEIANIKSIKLYRENLTVTTENQKSQPRRKTKQSATSKKRVSGLQRCRRRKREQKKAFKPTCPTVVIRRRSSRNSAVSQPKTEFTAPTVKGQGKCTSISQISKRKIKGRSNKSKLKTLQKGRSCHVHPNRRLRVSEVSNSPKVSKSSSRTLKKRKGSTIEEKPSKRVKGIEKTKLQPSQNVYLRSYSSDDIISIVRHCSKYSLADTAPTSPPVSLYLACQRESKDDLNQCVNDLMEVISGAHSQDMSLQESSETAPGLMLAAAIFIQSYKILIPAQKFLPTLDSVPLGNSTSSCKRPKGQINRLRVGGIVLNEADISTLDSTNWLNDKIIHSYLGLLSWQCNSKEPQSAYVLPCFVATKWENGDYSSWLFPKVPLHTYDIILLPVCHHDHWFLMVGYPKLETLLILDSLPNKQREKKFAKHWRCFMETRFQAEPATPLSWTLGPIKSSVQKDGHSCGVFVLMNSAAILSYISPQVMRLCHVEAYRAYVREELLTHGKLDKRSLACDLPFCTASYKKQIQCYSCSRWCHHACLGTREKDFVETCIYCA